MAKWNLPHKRGGWIVKQDGDTGSTTTQICLQLSGCVRRLGQGPVTTLKQADSNKSQSDDLKMVWNTSKDRTSLKWGLQLNFSVCLYCSLRTKILILITKWGHYWKSGHFGWFSQLHGYYWSGFGYGVSCDGSARELGNALLTFYHDEDRSARKCISMCVCF